MTEHASTQGEHDDLVLREPTVADGSAIWQLIERMGGLAQNSPYAYLLVGSHMAATSVVAEKDGQLVGFVSGYRVPTHQEVLFVWQVGVDPSMRGYALAKEMILDVLRREDLRDVRWLEATVGVDNAASQQLFNSIASHLDADIAVSPRFDRKLFPEGEGGDEELYRIGPIDRGLLEHPEPDPATETFHRQESVVRSYCRNFPTVFDRAEGHVLFDEKGRQYIDFFAGAGVLNYGHNNPILREKLVQYVERGGVTHSLDMYTSAKRTFLERLNETILQPRNMRYRVMFPGPTGTNAVESAIKLARKETRRQTIVSFTNGFHGMTLGALALTGNEKKRRGAGIPLAYSHYMPFDGYLGEDVDTVDLLRTYLEDPSSGVDIPAAIIVETVQAEGGVNLARLEWLKKLQQLCRDHDILFILDDIQVGCGRTGPFFSFEAAGLEPDLVVLSKSMSGYGLPFAIVLIRPDIDIWFPAEHNGTFRGHNLAMVTATAAMETYWRDDKLSKEVERKGELLRKRLDEMAAPYRERIEVRSRGLIAGVDFGDGDTASAVSGECFERQLIAETCGPKGNVLKLLPTLTIETSAFEEGLTRLQESIDAVMKKR